MHKYKIFSFALLFYALSITGLKANPLNCHLRMTNDYVEDLFMMSDVVSSDQECINKCSEFSVNSLESMKEEVEKLTYSCIYEDEIIYKFDIKNNSEIK